MSTSEAIPFLIKIVVHTNIYIEIDTDPYNEIVATSSFISHSVDIKDIETAIV